MKITKALRRRIARAAEQLVHRRMLVRYADATMIPRPGFLDNLRLLSAAAQDPELAAGAFLECGTWRGGMAAAMMEVGGPNRDYAFFDSFAGLPPVAEIDGPAALNWQSSPGNDCYHDNCFASRTDFEATPARTGMPMDRVSIHEGWFQDTVGNFPGKPIAVLRLDGDWYESTMTCLAAFWDHLLPRGLVLLDDYGVWDGCTRAVHDFLASRSATEAISSIERSGVSYIRKRATAP